jgi:hypothetical protein
MDVTCTVPLNKTVVLILSCKSIPDNILKGLVSAVFVLLISFPFSPLSSVSFLLGLVLLNDVKFDALDEVLL